MDFLYLRFFRRILWFYRTIMKLNRILFFIFLFSFPFPCIFAASPHSLTASEKPATSKSEETTPPPAPEPKKIESQTKKLEFFNAIELSGVGDLHIIQSDEQNFTVEAEDSILPLIKTYVKNKTLYIDLKNASKHAEDKINYYLNVKNLEKIKSYSSSTVFIKDGFKTEELILSIDGFGVMDANLNVLRLIAEISGGGKVNASGMAEEQGIEISGTGEYNGNKLAGKIASLKIKGSGIAKMNLSEKITVIIPEDGTLKYCGKPNLIKEVSKSAIVESLDQAECK